MQSSGRLFHACKTRGRVRAHVYSEEGALDNCSASRGRLRAVLFSLLSFRPRFFIAAEESQSSRLRSANHIRF